MSAASSPHKPDGPSKPDRCPFCRRQYAWRCRHSDDVFRASFGFRHHVRGWIYVHVGAETPEVFR